MNDGDEVTKQQQQQNGGGAAVSFQTNNGAPGESLDPPNNNNSSSSTGASKVVKTVKSFRELKALYEAKSTADKKEIAIPAKPSPVVKRFATPAAGATGSPSLPSPSPTRIAAPKPWLKEHRSLSISTDVDAIPSSPASSSSFSSTPLSSSLSPNSASGAASPPPASSVSSSSSLSTGTHSPVVSGSPGLLPGSSATLRRSSSTEASKPALMSPVASPRPGGAGADQTPPGRRSWGRSKTATGSLCLASSAVRLSDASIDSITPRAASPDGGELTCSSGGGVGDSWLKRITEEKGALERDDGPRSARDLSTAIEKGKVASVKEKFLVKGVWNDTPPTLTRSGTADLSGRSPTNDLRVPIHAHGASKSQENLTDDHRQRHGGSGGRRGGSRIQLASGREGGSGGGGGGGQHGRSNSDSINAATVRSTMFAGESSSKSGGGGGGGGDGGKAAGSERNTSSADDAERLVRSHEEVVTGETDSSSWALQWQRTTPPKGQEPAKGAASATAAEPQQGVKKADKEEEKTTPPSGSGTHEPVAKAIGDQVLAENKNSTPLQAAQPTESESAGRVAAQQDASDPLTSALNRIADEEFERVAEARAARKSDADVRSRRNSRSSRNSVSSSPASSPSTSGPPTPEMERREQRLSAAATVLQAATDEMDGAAATETQSSKSNVDPEERQGSPVPRRNKISSSTDGAADSSSSSKHKSKSSPSSLKRASTSIMADRESSSSIGNKEKRLSTVLERESKADRERRVKSEIRSPSSPVTGAVFSTSKSGIDIRDKGDSSSSRSANSSPDRRRSRKEESAGGGGGSPSPLGHKVQRDRPKSDRLERGGDPRRTRDSSDSSPVDSPKRDKRKSDRYSSSSGVPRGGSDILVVTTKPPGSPVAASMRLNTADAAKDLAVASWSRTTPRGESLSSDGESRTPRGSSSGKSSSSSWDRSRSPRSPRSPRPESGARASSRSPRADEASSTPRTPRSRRDRDGRDSREEAGDGESVNREKEKAGSKKGKSSSDRDKPKERERRDKERVKGLASEPDEDNDGGGGGSTISEGPREPVAKDSPAMKRFFVDFMNQNKASSKDGDAEKGHKSGGSGDHKHDRHAGRKSHSKASHKAHQASKDRLNGLDLEVSRRGLSDEITTETEVTAVSEWESETDKGTDTDTETDTCTETEELSDGTKQSRGVATRRTENNAAKVVSGEQDSSASEQDEDELALLGKSDKDVPTRKPGPSSSGAKSAAKTLGSRELSSEVAASPGSSPSTDRKLFGRVKDNNGSDTSASPAAALFGSPSKQRRKENRLSLIFSNAKPDAVDSRKPKTSQSIRSVYSAFLSRGSSSNVEVRSRDTTRSASLSEEPTSSADTLGAVSSTSFSFGSSSAVRTRAASGHGHSITTAEVLACEELDDEQEMEVDEPAGVEGEAEVKVVEEQAAEEDKEKAKAMDRLAAIAAKLDKGKRLNFEEAVLLFNHKPIRAMKQLIANGFVRSDPEDIARFLHSANNSLGKEQLGILLAENEDIFPAVLQTFIGQMDFRMFDFDIALRKLLFTFRLPGEAQKIDRIVKVWAAHWHDHNPGIFPEPKCAYVLAYAVIMLNTDAHNDMVRYKMTLKEFLVNVAHNDGGELIPQHFLEDIYPRIVEEEIRMEDEGALFPTASKKGWLQVRSKKPFKVWKRRWVVLTTDKIHILRKIGDKHSLQAIPLENLLMNTPIKDQGKKFLLFLYHAPTQDRSSDRSESSSKGSAGASSSEKSGSLKDKRKKEQLEGEKGGAKGGGKGSSELLDLNDRVVTVLCAFEREVFDGWVASITKNISIKSRRKKVSSTRF